MEKPKVENPNLKNLEVEDHTSANDLGRTFVVTVDANSVKSGDQDKEGVLEVQKHLLLLNLDGVETSMNAHDAQVQWSLCCAQEECMNLIPDAPCF